MKYVQPIGGAAGDPYVDANPASGIEGSPVPAGALEYPQRELDSLIQDAGLTPTNADLTQVAKAVRTLIRNRAPNSAAGAGTADAITAAYSPAITALVDRMELSFVATAANATTTPTFTPASGTVAAKTIVKGANQALVAGDISGAGHICVVQYSSTLGKWVLLNPATGVTNQTVPAASETVQGKVELATAAEAQGLTDALRAITPATLAASLQGGNQSLAANGYQKLPGGLILQWGEGEDTGTAKSFPIAFPNACCAIVATLYGNAYSSAGTVRAYIVSASQYNVREGNEATAGAYIRWIAIGY